MSSSALTDYVRMSAVDDLSYPLVGDDRTRDAVHTIVSGRKSWKTLKGKGEAVWPPYLEAALVEGAYPPTPPSASADPHPLAPSPRQVPPRVLALHPLPLPLPEPQPLHLRLHLPRHRQAQDRKAGRQPPPAAPRHLRRQTQCVHPPLPP